MLLLSTCLKSRTHCWKKKILQIASGIFEHILMELHLANHVSAGAEHSHLQLSCNNAAGRCRDNLKTIIFLTETKQTSLSASSIKVSDMFSTEGHPEARLDAQAWPNDAGRFNWNATKWKCSWAASCCPSLPIPHLDQQPNNASEKMCGWNWLNVCCRAKTCTSTKSIVFKEFSFPHWHLLYELYFSIPYRFYNRSLSQKNLPQHLIYCVKTAATWLLLWQQENCM